MCTIIIADDMKPICDGIEMFVKECFPNLEIIGSYYDGNDCLQAVRENIPDIIITDICMPGADGIQICKEIRKLSSKTQIIIISAFENFEYAKSAINYGVMKYLTKPYSIEELSESLTEAVNKVEAQKAATVNFERMSFIKYQYFIKTLHRIINGNSVPEEFESFLLLNDTVSAGQCYVAEVYKKPPYKSENSFNEDFDNNKMTVFSAEKNITVVFFKDKEIFSDYAAKELAKNNSVSKIFTFSQWSRFCYLRNVAKHFAEHIKECKVELFFRSYNYNIGINELPSLFSLINESLADNAAVSSAVSASLTVEQNLKLFAEQYFAGQEKSISEKIKSYISQNFADFNLSIASIADHFEVSQSYVCDSFKHDFGYTINEYIRDIRIQKAKQLLAESPNITIEDICFTVGYSSRSYFQHLFKKITQLTPSQYRKKARTK